ncbi:hypothetical protein [Secundilactobacillus folii]|uniref:Uncharacterized protein n=1 Tax=Secundilactobacillus folii TaxID=2678357 RepID=A0A7X3C3M9_9LACO|nr:hypothetical protein [Secundilactobacillus folii]MTV82469.1 hypothetical protein [Secundilactobacillus folii]
MMKYTKKRSQNKQAEAKRDATWEKFKHQQNTLAANKRGDRLRGTGKSKY